MAARSNSGSYYLSYDDLGCSIRGTAVYDSWYDADMFAAYYDPWGCYFTYTKQPDVSVSYIGVTYLCDGTALTYPGFERIGYYVHSVKAEQNNLFPNEMYYKIQHIPSDRVIDPAVGEVGWDKGQFMLFDLTANGKSSHYSVNLDSWVDPDN